MKHMKPELMHIHAGSQTIPWDHFWNCHVVDLFLNWSSSETHLSGLSLKKNPACETSHKIERWRMMMWKTKRICEIYFKRGSWRYDSEASAAPVRLQKATTGLLQHAGGSKNDPNMIRAWVETVSLPQRLYLNSCIWMSSEMRFLWENSRFLSPATSANCLLRMRHSKTDEVAKPKHFCQTFKSCKLNTNAWKQCESQARLLFSSLHFSLFLFSLPHSSLFRFSSLLLLCTPFPFLVRSSLL